MTAQDMTAYVAELEAQARRHELELETVRAEAKQHQAVEDRKARETEAIEKRRTEVGEHRWRVIMVLTIVLIGALLLTALGIWIYTATKYHKRPNPDDEREKACFAMGGGFIPRDMLDGSADDRGICVFPGKRATP